MSSRMDAVDGFLDDTALIKTPNSPLTSSTALRTKLRRRSKRNPPELDASYDPLEGSTFHALNEVTNVPNAAAMKMKFNESTFTEDRNSSLGILQMENFSDFADASLNFPTVTKKKKVASKKSRKSKLSNVKEDKSSSLSKKNLSPNDTVQSAQDTDYSHNVGSSDSSDIEYDGTNIPELNLDYDPLSSRKASKSFVPKKFRKESLIKDREESKHSTNASKNSRKFSSMQRSLYNGNFESLHSSIEGPRNSATNTTKPRDSIFENFDADCDSIFKNFQPNGSDLNSIEISELLKAPPFLDYKSLEMEPILQNQTLAEMHFMKNLEKLSLGNQNSPVQFCKDEISARSSSFRSSGASKNASQFSAVTSSTSTPSRNASSAEGLRDEMPSRSCLESSLEKSKSYNFTSSFKDKNSIGPSACSSKASSFQQSGNVTSNTKGAVSQGAGNFEYPSGLNFKDLTMFGTQNECGQNQFEISESDFVSTGEAVEIFKKDEEILNEQKRFEIGDNTNGSVFSNMSSQLHTDISAPSWFLENNGTDQRISIGTLINARTECLGRLSQDSQRERPFFGYSVSTPIREVPENTSSFAESDFQSASMDTTPVATPEGAFSAFYETPKTHFGKGEASGSHESAIKYVQQVCSPMDENSMIRGSVLSQVLNEMSTDQPDKIASKLLKLPLKKHQDSSTGSKRNVATSTNVSVDKADTLTRSSSEGSLGDTLTETPKNEGDNGSSTESKTQKCSSCCQKQSSRPPSSCSSVCSSNSLQNNLQAQYGCMKYFSSSQEHCHQLSCGSVARSDGCYNPYVQDMMRLQMLVPQPTFQQMVPSECGQFPFSVQGPAVPYPALQGPNELIFREKISVGDSQSLSLTVQNLHNMHFYHVSFHSAFINDEPVSLEIAGVSFPSMVPRSSGSTTDIQINLSPKYEGNIIVTLQVVASFNPANITLSALSSLSLQTKIKYESLRPCISIISKGQTSLNLGKVISGSTILEHITIFNKCDATVPLYISLSNDSENNRISFGLDHMKSQNHPASSGWKVTSSKSMRCRLPCSKDSTLEPSLDIPVVFEAGNNNADVSFTLSAAIESFSVREALGMFRITASVVMAKLVLADPKQNQLHLVAKIGSSSCRSLKLKNEGSFPVTYDLTIADSTQSLTVSPSTISLQPNQISAVSILFTPRSNEVIEGTLQTAAQPHGRVFRIADLTGEVKEANRDAGAPRSSAQQGARPKREQKEPRVARNGDTVECNKKFLFWAGVEVGNAAIKTFSIRNPFNKILKCKLSVKEKAHRFKLLDENNDKSTNLSLGLNAKEEKTISVAFAPSKTELSSGFLLLKPLLEKETKIFSMPLSGYGGIGKLKVTQVSEKEGLGSCLDIVLPSEKRPVFSSFTVQNDGQRAIFVKALFTPAGSLESSAADAEVSINPSEFVLCEKENKTLYISYTSGDDYGCHRREGGLVTLLYGDEVLRQQMRRTKNETSRSFQNDINFDVHCIGEEKVSHDPLYQCIPKGSSIFRQNVKKYLIHLNIVEQNASYSQMTFDELSTLEGNYSDFTANFAGNFTANSTVLPTAYSSRRLTAASNMGHSPPVKDFTTDMLTRLSMPHQISFLDTLHHGNITEVEDPSTTPEVIVEGWSVKPGVLTVDHSCKDKRVSLINNDKNDLKFKIESAIDVISVSPVYGVIPAKGEIGLRITIIPYRYSKLSEDYKGYIKVVCGGVEKSVLVNVLKEQKKTNIPEICVSNEQGQQQSILEESPDRAENTIISQPSVFIRNICDFPKEIKLKTTVPDKVSETLLTVRNLEKVPVRWDIHEISMLFTESLDDSLSPTQILQIKPSSGTLKSKEVSSIVIKFMPKRLATYSQFFELSISVGNSSEQKFNFKVYGKASFCLTESTELNISLTGDISKRGLKDIVYIENEMCEFPNTAVGQSSKTYAEVKNNTSSDVKFNIFKPNLPFLVCQSSIVVKAKKYLKIPVIFKPTKVCKEYEDLLILHCEDGQKFIFSLKATCK